MTSVVTHDGANVAGKWRAIADDDGSPALLTVWSLRESDKDDAELLRYAISIARLPEVTAASDVIRQLLDIRTIEPDSDAWIDGFIAAVWEWGECTLWDLWRLPDVRDRFDIPAVAAEVSRNVGAGLTALHAAGLIHADVTPNNIVLVADAWKLADLDSVVPIGAPARRTPGDPRWLHPDRIYAAAEEREPIADPVFDRYGLETILAELVEPGSTTR